MYDRCVLITNGNLLSLIALADWLRLYKDRIRKIYVTRTLPSQKSNIIGIVRMLRDSGWDYTWLKIWTNKIAPILLRLKHYHSDIKSYIKMLKYACPLQEVKSVNEEKIVKEIKSLNIQLLISFSATQKFCDDLINSPTVGSINIHYGNLPAYAGLSPYFWYLYNRERYYGVTLHKITSKLDAGSIIDQVNRRIGNIRSVLELQIRMASEVSPLLIRFFQGTTALTKTTEQDQNLRSYFRHPTKEQVRHLKSNGYILIDSTSRKKVYNELKRVLFQNDAV